MKIFPNRYFTPALTNTLMPGCLTSSLKPVFLLWLPWTWLSKQSHSLTLLQPWNKEQQKTDTILSCFFLSFFPLPLTRHFLSSSSCFLFFFLSSPPHTSLGSHNARETRQSKSHRDPRFLFTTHLKRKRELSSPAPEPRDGGAAAFASIVQLVRHLAAFVRLLFLRGMKARPDGDVEGRGALTLSV